MDHGGDVQAALDIALDIQSRTGGLTNFEGTTVHLLLTSVDEPSHVDTRGWHYGPRQLCISDDDEVSLRACQWCSHLLDWNNVMMVRMKLLPSQSSCDWNTKTYGPVGRHLWQFFQKDWMSGVRSKISSKIQLNCAKPLIHVQKQVHSAEQNFFYSTFKQLMRQD